MGNPRSSDHWANALLATVYPPLPQVLILLSLPSSFSHFSSVIFISPCSSSLSAMLKFILCWCGGTGGLSLLYPPHIFPTIWCITFIFVPPVSANNSFSISMSVIPDIGRQNCQMLKWTWRRQEEEEVVWKKKSYYFMTYSQIQWGKHYTSFIQSISRTQT